MKRMGIMAAGVLALSIAIHVSTTLAQSGGTATGVPVQTGGQGKTRVGLINLTYVVKYYNKFKAYQEDLKRKVDPFQAKDTALKTQAEKLAKDGQLAKSAEERERIEKDLKMLQRQVEDNKNDAQKELIKVQEQQLRTLYMDIRKVVDKIAQSHGYDMVLHYNDALTDDEYWSAQNIARKMQAGALVPMYFAGGLDISQHVVTTLNAGYGPAPTASGTTANGTAPGGR